MVSSFSPQHQMDSVPCFDLAEEAADEKSGTLTIDSSSNNILPPSVSASTVNSLVMAQVRCPHLCQGTSDECSCLAPPQVKLCSASSLNVSTFDGSLSPALGSWMSNMSLDAQQSRVLPSPTGQPLTADAKCDSSPDLPSASASSDLPSASASSDLIPSGQSTVSTETITKFFTARHKTLEKKRLRRLVSVAEGFSKVEKHFNGSHKPFCSGWPRISWPESTPETFEDRVVERLDRLKQIRQLIPREDWEAGRIWLICLAHEVEHISKWIGIDPYIRRGFSRVSAAIWMVEKHFLVKDNLKKSKNIFQVMKEGGPAAVLIDSWSRPPSIWERDMNMDDIASVYTYKRDILRELYEQSRSHDSDASHAIWNCFQAYGWSLSGLLSSNTKVVEILTPYLQSKRPRTGDGSGDSKTTEKRQRVDRLGASATHPEYDFPATSVTRFSPGGINQVTSSGIDNTVQPMPELNSSPLISLEARNRRNLTDFATMCHLACGFKQPDQHIDDATSSFLSYFSSSSDALIDPTTTSNLSYTINSSREITHLNNAEFLLWDVDGSGLITDSL